MWHRHLTHPPLTRAAIDAVLARGKRQDGTGPAGRRLLLVLFLAALLAACAPAPAPTAAPTATSTPTPTPAATATPTPTATPAVRVLPGATLPGTPTVGGRTWVERTWPAATLAAALDAALPGAALLADPAGLIHAWTDGEAWLLGQAPASFAWDDADRLWRQGALILLPDVALPGGWDAAQGRPGPAAAAELVFLLQDGAGAYRVAVLYAADPARPAPFPAGEAAAGRTWTLADGRRLYLAAAPTVQLAADETLRRAADGALWRLQADGARYRRLGAWAAVRTAAEVPQVGAFAGPLDMQEYGLPPNIPPIPYAPKELEDKYPTARYGFYDPKNLKAALIVGDKTHVAEAYFDKDQGVWVWQEVEQKLALEQAELTLDQAKKFIAGAEYWSEEEVRERFEGRVFVDEKSGRTIVLSKKALSQLIGDKQVELVNTAEEISKSEWGEILKQVNFDYYDKNMMVFCVLGDNQKPEVWLLKSDSEKEYKSRMRSPVVDQEMESRGYRLSIRPESKKLEERKISTYSEVKRFYLTEIAHWSDEYDGLVMHDGYQIKYLLDLNPQTQKLSWRPILPHERKNGEYELLTPEQWMRKAMADLKSVTGYDGAGVWTEGKPTVVDYTDNQGKKHHQELKVHLVHATQDPQSPIVYEVLEDPKTGEMVFTIRKAEKNQQNIQGLNEQQAQLVRQAWAYLLAADPEVMEKFVRVNKTKGVGVNPLLIAPATNNLFNGTIGLVLPRDIDNITTAIHLILVPHL